MSPILARNMAEGVVPVLESVVGLIPAVNNSVLRGGKKIPSLELVSLRLWKF
jgi:hypothetical protein